MKVPFNQEHLEAIQAEQDQKRENMIASWPKEIQEKMRRLEAAIKEIDSLNIPFSLHAAPFGWDFDVVNGKSFWWFGKLHDKNKELKEQDSAIVKARDELTQANQATFSKMHGIQTRIVHFEKGYPPFFKEGEKYYSLTPPKPE